MTLIIDSHEDMANNFLNHGRDYRLSAAEIRKMEVGTSIPQHAGQTLLGWEDYQRSQVALIFSTLFISPYKYRESDNEKVVYRNPVDARRWFHAQADYYQKLHEYSSDKFRLIKNRRDLQAVLAPWDEAPSSFPLTTHPVGLLMLMEGAEAIGEISELQEWWERGVRIVGPVWAGMRFCGGTKEPGGFTREGFDLLNVMSDLGFTLDIAHMTEKSCLQALDNYPGSIIVSHANVRSLIKGGHGERHLTDLVIHRLVERNGLIGVMPYNQFLDATWTEKDDRALITLDTLAAHIDHICQIAGNTKHVGIGTDFDGGFGFPSVPLEINTIADLMKLIPVLAARGYSEEDRGAIMGGNWRLNLENNLPE